jgi:hypothetical protein
LPPRIDATAEEVARVFMQARPPGPEVDFEQVYRCRVCERPVYFPEILYNDGRCEECHKAPSQVAGAFSVVVAKIGYNPLSEGLEDESERPA